MPHRILIVDDEPAVIQGYKRSLHKFFDVDVALSGHEALEQIHRNGPYAVVVSDMRMPVMDGLQLLTTIKRETPDTVRIMLTGNADQKTAVDAVNTGRVYRFINKPCSPDELAEALKAALQHYDRVQESRHRLTSSEKQARQLAKKLDLQYQRDYLTGLFNRQALKTRIDTELQKMPQDEQHTFCVIDVDHFHVINDSIGHIAGDECLRQMSQIITSRQRGGDLVARISGNRFCLFLRHCTAEEGQSIAEEMLDQFRNHRFLWEEKIIDVSISIGLATFDHEAKDFSKLLSLAETACYVAKDHGGNQLHVVGTNDRELTRRLDEPQWISCINHALKDDRFVLFYQPIVPLAAEEKGEHYEILIRLRDEDDNLVAPYWFLPAAENYMLAPKIDCWVIRKVMTWFQKHPQQLEKLAVCSINLSGQSLGSQQLLDFILRAFDERRLPTHKFCFEITETAAIAKLSVAIHFIETLRSKGFLFSLDDFGSGLSSFAYLKNFPVDYLKIDGQFVRDIDKDPIDLAMVRSINEIGKIMGKKTIAEYVENDEIKQILGDLSVDYAQGYVISRPIELSKKAEGISE